MDDSLIQNDYSAHENDHSHMQKMEMSQSNETKQSLWITHRVIICTVVGLVVGCVLTICILWPIYSMGMDKVLQQKCPEQPMQSRLTNSEIDSLIYIEHGNTSHDGIDWSGPHQAMGLQNIFTVIEGSTNKTLQDLESIRRSRVEMESLLGKAITSCTGACPDGWQQYNGVCYWFSNRTETWQRAKAGCAKYPGAILAEPKDSQSESFISGHSIDKGTGISGAFWLATENRTRDCRINHWIGLTDLKKEGDFRWESTGDPVQFSNWVPGDPNNAHGNEHCVMTNWHRKWADAPCDWRKHYVCQKTMSGQNALQKMKMDVDLLKNALQTSNQNDLDKLKKTGEDIVANISEILTQVDKGHENVKVFSKQIEEALLEIKNITDMALGGNIPGIPPWVDNSTFPSVTQQPLTTEPPSCLSDCKAWYDSGSHGDDVYCIQPDWASMPAFDVYCDMTTDGGGWVVFQRRVDGSEDFFLDWDSYRDGFGNLTAEFWLGNKYIHMLTEEPSELRVDLLAWDNTTAFAKFSNFEIGDERSKFTLTISGYSGTAGDALDYHKGHKFSTKDQDNSKSHGGCAKDNQGAWWYNYCSHSSLNGKYYVDRATSMHTHNHGVNWEKFKGDRYSLKGSSMMLRRK